jgi:hypothetical protein
MLVDVAGRHWVRIGEVAAEVARQLSCEVVFGEQAGEEVLVDPTLVKGELHGELPLSEGVSRVIQEAKVYLGQRGLLS